MKITVCDIIRRYFIKLDDKIKDAKNEIIDGIKKKIYEQMNKKDE